MLSIPRVNHWNIHVQCILESLRCLPFKTCPMSNFGAIQQRSKHMDQRVQVELRMQDTIDNLKRENRYRTFMDVERLAGIFPHAVYHAKDHHMQKPVITFCSNDYMSMGQHPSVTKAMIDVITRNGAGAGGTRNISGSTHYHSMLESELADLHGKDSALLFTSGFVANDSAIGILGKIIPDMHIFSDESNHASLIEGVRHSSCTKHIFRHNDTHHLEHLLESCDPNVPKMIVFESVYSMDGSIAPIEEICDLAERHQAITFLDEVHAIGLYGDRGGGIAQCRGLQERINVISGSMSKGIGVLGGYMVGSEVMIDAIRSCATGFIFTTSIPPCVVAGAIASIRHIKTNPKDRHRHQERAQQLKDLLSQSNIPFLQTESHIVPVMVGDAHLCKQASDMLLQKYNIYIQPINYPTVARGTERLRITPSPEHSYEMLCNLIVGLEDVWQTLKLPSSK